MPGDYRSFSELDISIEASGVMVVTLNRPQQLNAWNAELLENLNQLWPLVAEDGDVGVVVVTGAGSAFSVGGDYELIASFPEDLDASIASSSSYGAVMRGMMELPKPIVAAINGDVLGGGLGLALLSDVSFMADDARMMCGAQLNINVIPAPEIFLWRYKGIPDAKAKYHLLRSSTLTASEAERIGLISSVVDSGRVLEEALAYAVDIAGRDPLSIGWTKRSLNQNLRSAAPLLDELLALEALSFGREAVGSAIAKLRSAKQ